MIDQYITFFIRHWALTLLFIVTVVAIVFYEMIRRVTGVRQVNPQEAVQLINRDDAVIFDMRDLDVFKNGHIIRAIHLKAAHLEEEIKKRVTDFNKPIIILGHSDQMSLTLAKRVLNLGFQSVQVLNGGLGAWQTAGLPLVKD